MSKNSKIIAGICGGVAAVAIIAVVAVVLINNNQNSPASDTQSNSSSSSQETTSEATAEPTNNENSSTSLVGKWKYYDSAYISSDIEFIYTFNADGTGNYYAAGTDMPFTYTVDGSTLTINYDSGPFETEYELNGDILNVKDSGGSDTLYKKM